mmetsp:Transcript_30040/g.86182  ORF Transcript_30040/g.86182 Transcript_30040/m.86182 type:complete len:215 (+) Transcript_30040:3502-4146(+)
MPECAPCEARAKDKVQQHTECLHVCRCWHLCGGHRLCPLTLSANTPVLAEGWQRNLCGPRKDQQFYRAGFHQASAKFKCRICYWVAASLPLVVKRNCKGGDELTYATQAKTAMAGPTQESQQCQARGHRQVTGITVTVALCHDRSPCTGGQRFEQQREHLEARPPRQACAGKEGCYKSRHQAITRRAVVGAKTEVQRHVSFRVGGEELTHATED